MVVRAAAGTQGLFHIPKDPPFASDIDIFNLAIFRFGCGAIHAGVPPLRS